MATTKTPDKKVSDEFFISRDQIDRIIKHKYEPIIHEKDGERVTIYHDSNIISPNVVDNLFDFISKINKDKKTKRSLVILDWSNVNAGKYIKAVQKVDKEALFILVPNPLIINPEVCPEFGTAEPVTLLLNKEVKVKKYKYQMNSLSDESSYFKARGSDINEYFDSSGMLLGIYHYNYVKIYHDGFFSSNKEDDSKEYVSFLSVALSKKYNDMPSPDDKKAYDIASGYNKFVINKQEAQKKECKTKLNESSRKLSDQYLAIQRLEKETQEASTLLRSLSIKQKTFSKEHLEHKKLFEQFKTLMKTRFTDIYFESNRIVAYTNIIYINATIGEETKWYKIGVFEVSINLNGTINLVNNTNKYSDYDHPHINRGAPCLGNYKNIVPKMIMNGDYLGVLMIAYDFLSTYVNISGFVPYVKINEGWQVVTEKEVMDSRGLECKTVEPTLDTLPPTEDEEFVDDEDFDDDE